MQSTLLDISELKRAQRLQVLSAEVLRILNDPQALPDAAHRILDAIRRDTGVEAVGIRFRQGDDFPYAVAGGFSESFLEAEHSLLARTPDGGFCLDAHGRPSLVCTCGLILSGNTDPANPLFTPFGSAWTNDAQTMLHVPPDQDPRLQPRNRCLHEGYQSVALIPIRADGRIIGLLQLNDRRKGWFTPESIRFFEGLAASFGVALMRLKGEDDLRRSQRTLRSLFDAVPESLFLMQLDGVIQEANGGFAARFEKSVAECVDHSLFQLLPPHLAESRRSWMAEVLATRLPTVHEESWGERWFRHHYSPVFGSRGEVERIVGLAIDITERKRLEEQRETALVKYRTLFDTLPLGVTVADRQGRILESNRVAGEILEIPGDRAATANIASPEWRVIRPDGTPMPPEEFASVRALREQCRVSDVEMGLVKAGDRTTWISVTAAPVPLEDVGVVITYTDIGDRKRAEAAFRESELRRGLALAAARMGTWEWDLGTGRHVWSDVQEALWGYAPGTFPGTTEAFTARIHPEDLPSVWEAGAWGRTHRSPFQCEYRVIHPDGQVRWISSRGEFQWDAQGAPTRVVGVVFDITNRKRWEETLAAEATRRRILIEGSQDGIVVVDEHGQVYEANRRFAEMLGYAPEEVLRLHVWEWDCHWTREQVLEAIVRDQAGARFETRHRRKDGSEFDVEVSSNGAELGGQILVFCVCHDLTERKRLESQLRQAQKLEAVGQLAGGIAHDFNNIVAGMMLQLGLLRMNDRLDDATRQAVRELDAEARRAAAITRQLLMFSRRSVLEMRTLDLNQLIRDLLKMLGRLIGEHIQLVLEECPDPRPHVSGDPGMLEQVLMNLVVNARDALPRGGRVTIGTRIASFGEDEVRLNANRRAGTFACLTVADNGVGMSENTLKRVFEPFFTTKEAGKGTGLGLATVHGIVAQHQGWVEVESRLGQGSTFHVLLPGVPEPDRPAPVETPASEPIVRGRETILVVEDEAHLRLGICLALRALGYRVHEAEDAVQALARWQELGPEIDLLLTDMVMPEGLTGLELGEQLRRLKPELRVIISSGYSDEIVRSGGLHQPGIFFLPKPYRIPVLAQTVRTCLDGRL